MSNSSINEDFINKQFSKVISRDKNLLLEDSAQISSNYFY
jgi:hypothetical protein